MLLSFRSCGDLTCSRYASAPSQSSSKSESLAASSGRLWRRPYSRISLAVPNAASSGSLASEAPACSQYLSACRPLVMPD